MEEIRASMAGIVQNLLVQPGDRVEVGQDVIIMESMKMEVPINATGEGTVQTIKVDIGDFVNEGDLLLVLG